MSKLLLPAPVGVDTQPPRSTTIGILGYSLEPTPEELMEIPLLSSKLLSLPVFEGWFNIPVALGIEGLVMNQTRVYLNDVGPTWRNVVYTSYQYMNVTKRYRFKLFGPSEIKGVFRFDIFDFPEFDATTDFVTQNANLDIAYQRNRHLYWDLSTNKEFVFDVNPVANFGNKSRWNTSQDLGIGAGNYNYQYTIPATPAVQASNTLKTAHPDRNDFASVRMVLDKAINWLPNCPTSIQILYWTEYVNPTLWAPKGYAESGTQRALPNYNGSRQS